MEDLNLNKCTICIEDILTDIEYLPCAHSFHKECIDEWTKTNNTCPICKIPIYIVSPEHLRLYNYYKNIEEEEKKAESTFFHQISAGLFDQSISNLNNTSTSILNPDNHITPTVYSESAGLSESAESELDDSKMQINHNQSAYISINISELHNIENPITNPVSASTQVNNINLDLFNSVVDADNLNLFNLVLNALSSSSINIDYLNITNVEDSEDDT